MAWPWKGLSWETACDTDDLSPSCVHIIAKPSPWVVLLMSTPQRLCGDTGWAVQDDRVSVAGKPAAASSATVLEKAADCG